MYYYEAVGCVKSNSTFSFRTLNNNNLTYLALEPVAVTRLSTLRLTDNPVVCDCRMARLAAAAKSAGILGVGARYDEVHLMNAT